MRYKLSAGVSSDEGLAISFLDGSESIPRADKKMPDPWPPSSVKILNQLRSRQQSADISIVTANSQFAVRGPAVHDVFHELSREEALLSAALLGIEL